MKENRCCDLELGLYPISDAEILRNKRYTEKNTTKSIREQKDEELKIKS